MTSIANKSAHSAVSASLKSSDMSVIKNRSNMNDIEAETIEVIPELPFHDSEDDFSEYSDENETATYEGHSFGLNDIGDDNDDDDDGEEPFDEYAYQVMSNHNEPQTIWFDNSQLKSLPLNNSTGNSDVILIDDDDSDDDFIENSFGGLTHEPSGNSATEQKVYTCGVCQSKLSSSYNLKRHYMIHTGEKPFECETCHRRFMEQSDLRKHKKVHDNNNGTAMKCSVCNRNPTSSRHSRKCISCEKEEAAKIFQTPIPDDYVPGIDANNKKSFVCKFCDRAFGSSSNLKRHVMIHTCEKPFKCPDCSRPFREMSTLKKHLITHRKQNGFVSNTIPKPPALMEMKQQQITKVPSKPAQLPQGLLHKCPLCKTICRGTENFMNHITSVHPPNNMKKTESSNVTNRKRSKSPPPLIPINKAAFLNAKRV